MGERLNGFVDIIPNERYSLMIPNGRYNFFGRSQVMIQLYGHELSGNSYKAKLMLSLIGLDFEWLQVDLLKGVHKQKDGKIDLEAYPHVLEWMDRVRQLPGFVGVRGIEVPGAA